LLRKLVMITISQSLPAIVFVRTVFRILSFESLVHNLDNSSQQSE
jgi:uncharacterized oligopeptide transporter (OPT) family protein